jgi:hypothetical protein
LLRVEGANAQLRIDNSTTDRINLNVAGSSDSMSLSTGGSIALTIDSSQNVTFADKLNLHKANGTGLTSYIGIRDSGTSSVRSGLGLGTADSTLVLYVDKNNAIGSGSALVLQTGGTDALTINGSQNATFAGNVVVNGRIEKTGELYINPTTNLRLRGNVITFGNAGGTSEFGRFDSSGRLGVGVSPTTILNIKSAKPILKLEDTTAYNSSPRNRIEFRNIFNADTVQHPAGYIDLFSSNSTAGNYETHMAFTTRTASSGLVEAMRIDSRQNVGIGVFSSLDHKLTIKTSAIGQDWIKGLQSDGGQGFRISADSGDDAVFELGSASTSDMVVLRADGNSHFYGGNVGIGTKSPDTLLHLTEAGGATLRITNSSDGASDETHIGTVEFEGHDGSTNRAGVMAKIVARYSDTGSGDAIDGSANEGGSLGFYTSIATTVGGAQTLAEKMRIENNGKVGIGTTSPSELLTISNSSDTNKTKLAIVGGTKGFTIGKTFQSQSYGHIRPISSGQVMALRLMPNTTDQDTYLELFGHDYETETTNFARGMLVLKQSDGNAFQIISDANGSEML